MDTRSIGMQRYHETARSSSSPSFPHPPPINHRRHNHHHSNLPMQGVRGRNINFHPQVAAASYRTPTNLSRSSTLRPALNSLVRLEMAHWHPVSVRSTGLQAYHPHSRGFVPETTPRQHNLPHWRVLRADVLFSLPSYPSYFTFSLKISSAFLFGMQVYNIIINCFNKLDKLFCLMCRKLQ